MATLCETLISTDIAFACDDLVKRGLEPDGLIINRADIDFSSTAFDAQNPNIIKTLILRSGKKAYEIQQLGNTPFTGTQTELVAGTYRNTWTHTIPIAVLANNPDVAKNVIDGLANGKFVVILKNHNDPESGNHYQVYGYEQGLVASAGISEKYSEETDGGWLITLTETGAPKSAMFFYKEDDATTDSAYEALKTAAV